MFTAGREVRLETRALVILSAGSFLLFGMGGNSGGARRADARRANPASNLRALVEQMVNNEIRAQNEDAKHWRFCKTTVKGGVSKTWNVVETKDGEVKRLVAINGRPLSAEEQRAEEERMQKFLSSPEEQAKERESAAKDYQKEQELMKALPEAFLYTYAGRRGDLERIRFRANPQFHPATRDEEVLPHVGGVMVIDVKSKRLVEFRGDLTSGVKFGYGVLGYLNKGGTFDVRQQDVAGDHWDVTLLEMNITGKALLFKSIAIQEKILEGGYRRVSDNLTLQQAANLLKGRASQEAFGGRDGCCGDARGQGWMGSGAGGNAN